MKVPPSWSGNVLHGQSQEPNQRKRPPAKAKSFDTLVARHYPAVYNFACRFTDDPRKAGVLTRDAFISTRKQLRTCCDENVLASILISNVIRAGLPLESNSGRPPIFKKEQQFRAALWCSRENRDRGYFKQLCDSMTPWKQSRPNKLEPFILSSPNTANISHTRNKKPATR